jgi:hypothetical protein
MPRKKTPPAPPVPAPEEQLEVTTFGHELDPIDGRPVFADGMSRRRWLEATAEDRNAQLVAELRADPIPDDSGE